MGLAALESPTLTIERADTSVLLRPPFVAFSPLCRSRTCETAYEMNESRHGELFGRAFRLLGFSCSRTIDQIHLSSGALEFESRTAASKSNLERRKCVALSRLSNKLFELLVAQNEIAVHFETLLVRHARIFTCNKGADSFAKRSMLSIAD